MLIAAGCRNITDTRGHTALHYAPQGVRPCGTSCARGSVGQNGKRGQPYNRAAVVQNSVKVADLIRAKRAVMAAH